MHESALQQLKVHTLDRSGASAGKRASEESRDRFWGLINSDLAGAGDQLKVFVWERSSSQQGQHTHSHAKHKIKSQDSLCLQARLIQYVDLGG